MNNHSLRDLELPALTGRLYELRKQERLLLVEFLEHLAELDRRKAYVEMGYATLFAFLTGYLGYPNGSAYRRMTSARLLAKHPAIAAYLADGRLGVTTLLELRELLDDETTEVPQLLERAAGKSEPEVKALVAALRPREAPPDLLRRLPAQAPQPPAVPIAPPPPSASAPAPPPRPPRPRIEPISAELHTLRITVDRSFVDDLEAVRAALSHQIPDRNLVRVLHECVRRVRRDLARRREGAAERPLATPRPSAPGTRHVPAAIERALYARDGGRCTYVGPDGHVCGSTQMIQIHHKVPYARGGPMTLDCLALMCAVHNAFLAEQDFGRETIERAIAARQLALL